MALCVLLTQALDALAKAEAWSIAVVCLFGVLLLISTFLIFRNPQNPTKATFMVGPFKLCEAIAAHFLSVCVRPN